MVQGESLSVNSLPLPVKLIMISITLNFDRPSSYSTQIVMD
jgi:hypothetical protein